MSTCHFFTLFATRQRKQSYYHGAEKRLAGCCQMKAESDLCNPGVLTDGLQLYAGDWVELRHLQNEVLHRLGSRRPLRKLNLPKHDLPTELVTLGAQFLTHVISNILRTLLVHASLDEADLAFHFVNYSFLFQELQLVYKPEALLPAKVLRHGKTQPQPIESRSTKLCQQRPAWPHRYNCICRSNNQKSAFDVLPT